MFVERRPFVSLCVLATACLISPAPAQMRVDAQLEPPFNPARALPDVDSHDARERLVLQVGEQKVLSADGVRGYSEGQRGIVDVRLTRAGDHFILVGQKEGETTLLLMMLDGTERQIVLQVGDGRTEPAERTHEVRKEDNIRLDLYFVQIDRSNSHQIGVGYPGNVTTGSAQATFDFMTQRFQSATAVVEDQALLRLDMAQSTGFAKLMRKAAIITENGKKAEFSGGGEVNIPITGSLATGIHKIEFGSQIKVLPLYDSRSGRIQIELAAEISDLTDDRGSGAPGRVTATVSSIVNLELGQALVLAGLTSESKLRSRTGVPFLSQLPILGYFFGSDRLSRQVADNVIFIVPTVLDAATRDAREQIKTAFDAYREYEGGNAQREVLRETWRTN